MSCAVSSRSTASPLIILSVVKYSHSFHRDPGEQNLPTSLFNHDIINSPIHLYYDRSSTVIGIIIFSIILMKKQITILCQIIKLQLTAI